MQNGLYTIVDFGNNDKWFVVAEKIINNTKYSYLIKVNDAGDDFIDKYQLMKSTYDETGEYMEEVTGNELKEVLPILMPEAKEIMENPNKLKELLNN